MHKYSSNNIYQAFGKPGHPAALWFSLAHLYFKNPQFIGLPIFVDEACWFSVPCGRLMAQEKASLMNILGEAMQVLTHSRPSRDEDRSCSGGHTLGLASLRLPDFKLA